MNLTEIRQSLHRIPELGFEEHRTQEFILQQLKQYPQLTLHTFEPTGITAVYNAAGDAPYLLFRADMDGLPIVEKTGCVFASEFPERMHACGHDIHMTVLLGLIDYVCGRSLPVNILFVFQPAEEGRGGAQRMLETGFFDAYEIEACFALHVGNHIPAGTVSSKAGIFFAIPQEFKVEFSGKSAHIAFPSRGHDALAAGVMFYQSIQTQLNQRFDATEPAVCYVGRFEAGVVMNAVPAHCQLEGTTRTLSRESWQKMNHLIEETAEHAGKCCQTPATVTFMQYYEPVINDPAVFQRFRDTLPSDTGFIEAETVMTGEDFGFFTTRYPGLLFWVGADSAQGDIHSPVFLPGMSSVETGLEAFVSVLKSYTEKKFDR